MELHEIKKMPPGKEKTEAKKAYQLKKQKENFDKLDKLSNGRLSATKKEYDENVVTIIELKAKNVQLKHEINQWLGLQLK